MTFNVSNEVKAQLLADRIHALNLEGYQNELNLKSAEAPVSYTHLTLPTNREV